MAEETVKPVTEETKDELLEIMKKSKYMTYTLQFASDDFPKITEVRIKRWSFGPAAELMPMAIEVVTSCMSAFLAGNPSGELDLGTLLTSHFEAQKYSMHLQTIQLVVAKTLMLNAKDNGFEKETEAMKFVRSLEIMDVVEIIKILYKQNLETLVKKAVPGNVKTPNVTPITDSVKQLS